MEDLIRFIQRQHERCKKKAQENCAGIIYVHKREDTVDLALEIQRRTGIAAAGYHGGLKDAERTQVQQDWTTGKTPIAIATVAFGMGIDLAHVRYVVHWSLPKTVESFYQESGRAGRDGLESFSLLYFSKSDVRKFQYLIQQRKTKDDKDNSSQRALDALESMDSYATSPGCRRAYLLQHFGEKSDPKTVCGQTCDWCSNPQSVKRSMQAAAGSSYQPRTTLSSEVYTGAKRKGKGFFSDDEEDEFEEDLTLGDLGINHYTQENDISHDKKPNGNFQKASSILSKYEVRLLILFGLFATHSTNSIPGYRVPTKSAKWFCDIQGTEKRLTPDCPETLFGESSATKQTSR